MKSVLFESFGGACIVLGEAQTMGRNMGHHRTLNLCYGDGNLNLQGSSRQEGFLLWRVLLLEIVTFVSGVYLEIVYFGP